MKYAFLRSRSFQRILIIKPSAFGDVVHTLPVLVKLRCRYPQARIDWLITPENADLIRCHPDLSNPVLFARKQFARFGRSWQATAGLVRFLAALRRTRYDLVIDLHGQVRGASSSGQRCVCAHRFRSPAAKTDRSMLAAPRQDGPGARLDRLPGSAWLAYTHRIPIPTL